MNDYTNCEPNSLTNINIEDIDKSELSIQELTNYLRYNGRIKFKGLDYKELSRTAVLGLISESQFNELINFRFRISCIETAVADCERLGLKIVEKYFNGIYYNITAERVKPNGQ